MSNKTENDDKKKDADESVVPMAGERLAEARRDSQIALIDIVKELHLDEHKVRALECNNFDVLGAPVFAKGYLRKYAQLVKVNETEVMADYYQLTRTISPPSFIMSRSKPYRTISLGPWIFAIVVIAVAAIAYWWFKNLDMEPVQPVIGEVAPLPTIDKLEVELNLSTKSHDDSISALEDKRKVATVTELPIEIVSIPDVSETQLSITYSGDCWTEISDANGHRLFFDLGKSGRTVNLSGVAPFNILFGDAANVILLINGSRFDIPAEDLRGRTARLTIIAP